MLARATAARTARSLTRFLSTMGVDKTTISEGDGKQFPAAGDKLTMHYTGTRE